MPLYESILLDIGDDESFATVGEFANSAVHFFFDRLIVFLFEYNHVIDEQLKKNPETSYGGTKLGLIYRHIYTDKDWNYAPDCDTKQLTIRITPGFAKKIDEFNKSTGFFSSRADFCRNALGCYQTEVDLNHLAMSVIENKSKTGFKNIYQNIHCGVYAVNKPAAPGFGLRSKADSKDWLN